MVELSENQLPAATAHVTYSNEGIPTIAIAGELDISSVDLVRPTIETVVEGSPNKLFVELGDLKFMDSSGIALLLYAAEKIDAIELLSPSPIVRRVVELTGLTSILRITDAS